MDSNDQFNIDVLYESLENCLAERSLRLDPYLHAFKELCKFCRLLGKLFTFVSHDIEDKIMQLNRYCSGEQSKHYKTCLSMLAYEKNSGLLYDTHFVSGSQIIIRLHRALEFLDKFLTKLIDLKMGDKMGNICKESYNDSLAKYHSWLVRKAVLMAIPFLPTKQELANRICGACHQMQQHILEVLPKVVHAAKQVYSQTKQIFKDSDCMDLL